MANKDKDWTGNSKSNWTMLGASNHSELERQHEDFYATHPIAMEKLLEREQFSDVVWEPAVGQGHLADVLKNHGYDVIVSDVVNRGYPGTIVQSFFDSTKQCRGGGIVDQSKRIDIITNPPYKFAQEFVEHALDVSTGGTKIAMFLKIQFLEGASRYELFKKNPPRVIYVFSRRVMCAKNGRFDDYDSSAMAYAWFVWEKGFCGDPVIKWIGDLDSCSRFSLIKDTACDDQKKKRKELW